MEIDDNQEKKDNSNVIAFWDAGDEQEIATNPSKQSIKDKKGSQTPKKKQTDTGAWKEWDEL